MISEITRLTVRDPGGVFAARQIGRELAIELGLERQDQVRVAAAISEVSRSAVVAGLSPAIVFGASDEDLVITVTMDGQPPADGTNAAARLMDTVEVSGPAVRMAKRRPRRIRADARAIIKRLNAAVPMASLDELRRDNEDLMAALEDLRQQKDQLLALNAELEETNRGVMALHSQLSDELEQTNQGVVALYAELDDKSEQLRQASEAKNRFWANVSHELRTPLSSIIGLTRLLAEPTGGSLDSEQLYQVELIRSSASNLLTLVNDLLDVAKAESGQIQIDPANVNLPALLGRLRALAGPMAGNKPIDIVVDPAGAPGTILTDEVALTGILRNLLSNAIKYTDTGEVRLSARTEGATVKICVADTGIGIPASQRDRVFEEFYQVPGTRREGTGLGLPYARRLAELLGGDLALTSEPGAGTTVVLTLPQGMPAIGTVLVADDDPGFRQAVRGLLTGIADRVVEAGDGEQALAAMAGDHVDLVLADLRMPGVDGYELLEQLPGSVPAIVITGLQADLPQRAASLLHKEELTRERLAFTIRRISRSPR
jgi:signal transduction histidine kinase/CheY-like chemotaxis protein